MHLVLAYKNFAAKRNISHIGLGVAAINTSKSLRAALGHTVDVWPIVDANHLRQKLNLAKSAGEKPDHVIVSAPWIETPSWRSLLDLFPRTQFGINCHSNVGFLQADPNGIRLLREGLALEMGVSNFHVSANSRKGSQWVRDAYGKPCGYLPNLYFLDSALPVRTQRPLWGGGPLRIGAFGATRPLKNLISAVAGAIEISYQLKADTEIWLSSGRTEGGGETVLNACRALTQNLPHVKLVLAGWADWAEHRSTVANMHLLLQPSYTESFNMVTADGIAEGVPSVVSDAIDWVPPHWQASVDNVFDIARVGRALLGDPHAVQDGVRALQTHNQDGLQAWKEYLAYLA
jgi:glycosyltransferase involved in cell wall biosynthesis